MSEGDGIRAIKPLTTIYSALLLSVIALLIMSQIFALDVADYRMRLVSFVFFACALMIVIGAEIGRVIFKSGITPIGFIGFLITNLFLIQFLFASFVDHMGNDFPETSGAMIGTLLLGGVVWYAIIVVWSLAIWFRDWRSQKKSEE